LADAFAHYEVEDVWQALLATMELFAWLERETAVSLHYINPSDREAQTVQLVHTLFENR
jgi:hypothetical protein